jgi:heptosyltransferase-2
LKPDLSSIKRVLVIQTAYLGDLIWTTPLIQTLGRALPCGKIDILTIPQNYGLLEGLPEVGEIIYYDKRSRLGQLPENYRLLRLLQSKKYQLTVSAHLSLRSALIARASRAGIRLGLAGSAAPRLYTHLAPTDERQHFVERYLALAQALGIKNLTAELRLIPSPQARAESARLLEPIKAKGLLAVFPGSVWATKRYPAEKMASAAQAAAGHLGWGVVLLGSRADVKSAKEVEKRLQMPFIDLSGKTSLSQLKGVVASCDVCLANDSGGLHLATALGIPVVAIYGPTHPRQGIGPWRGKSISICAKVPCSPCSAHGSKTCPRGDMLCMETITPGQVAGAIIGLAGGKKRRR